MKNWSPTLSRNFTWLLVLSFAMVIGFCIWLGLNLLVHFLVWSVGYNSDFWNMLEALSTAAGLVTFIVAGFFAYRQLVETLNSRYLEVADRLFEELNSPENIAARRWIYLHLDENPSRTLATMSEEHRQYIKTVLNSLDRVAFLTQSGWIPEEMVMPWMSPMVVKAWMKLEPYVDYEAKRRNEPFYYEGVREIASQCILWMKQNVSDATINWVNDAL